MYANLELMHHASTTFLTESSNSRDRKMVVQTLFAEHGRSERCACQTSGIASSTLRYRCVARDDSGDITVIQTHKAAAIFAVALA